jgi:cardiolipin synthase A/B
MSDWLSSLHLLPALTPIQKTIMTIASFALLGVNAWAIVRTISRGHGVNGTLAWIFAIIAFPLIGVVAFFVIASPSVKRVTLRKRRASAEVRRRLAANNALSGNLHEPADSLLDLAATLTGLPPTTGNEVSLLTDEGPTFDRIEAALQKAKRYIWSEYYVIRNDLTGRRFLDILAERAKAGIEVRLIYDALGSMTINAGRLEAVIRAGGRSSAFQPMNPLRRRLSVHLRNHRKLIVLDGEVGFTGGMNVGDEYSGRRHREGVRTYHDSHLELRGPAVRQLAHAFIEDWSFATGEVLDLPPRSQGRVATREDEATAATSSPSGSPEGTIVAIVPSGPDQEHNASAFVHFAAIASARRRVLLTSPYFIPDESTVSALVSAALRRVDVRVLVPQHNNMKLIAFAARAYYGNLLRGGVRIFEYEPEMLHAKTLVVDGHVAIVGSANVDIRSFRLNFEIGAMMVDTRLAADLERRFACDAAHAHEITLDELARMRWHMRVRCAVAKLLSPIL